MRRAHRDPIPKRLLQKVLTLGGEQLCTLELLLCRGVVEFLVCVPKQPIFCVFMIWFIFLILLVISFAPTVHRWSRSEEWCQVYSHPAAFVPVQWLPQESDTVYHNMWENFLCSWEFLCIETLILAPREGAFMWWKQKSWPSSLRPMHHKTHSGVRGGIAFAHRVFSLPLGFVISSHTVITHTLMKTIL